MYVRVFVCVSVQVESGKICIGKISVNEIIGLSLTRTSYTLCDVTPDIYFNLFCSKK